ncbi:chromosome condensation complex Condensin, subunit G [Coniothyrium glycines]
MPGRTASRSTRAPAASTRKTSSGTVKSTRASSARQSSNAIEIPDEGESTSLRTQIAQIFGDAQRTTATQRKLANNLRKIQESCCFAPPTTNRKGGKKSTEEDYEDFEEEDFNNEILRCVLRIIAIKKGEPVGDRLIRFLCLFLKYAAEKDQAIFANENEADADAAIQTPSMRLQSQLLTTVLGHLNAKDKTTRFRSTQIVQLICNTLDTMDDDLFNLIRLGLSKRLRDKEPSVRVQAALGIGRLAGNEDDEQDDEDSDDDTDGGLHEKLIQIMVNDPSAEVRRAVLTNMPFWPSTLKFILERARDMDPSIRRMLYGKILPALGDFRHMSMIEREKIIRWGLRDRDDTVRKAAGRLFSERWLEDCAATHDHRPEEEKKPGETAPPSLEALCELLERIDVTQSGQDEGMAHEAMREFWTLRPDYINHLQFDHEFWKNLDPSTAYVARTLNDFAQTSQDDRIRGMVEDKMPEVTIFAYVLQKELNSLMEQVQKHALMEHDDPDLDEAEEELEDQHFVVQQLLYIAHTLDYTDEMGRRQMYNIMREAIAKAQFPEECTKLAIEALRIVCGVRGESDFCALIMEAIAEVRDTLLDSDDDSTVKGGDDDEESFHSAQADLQEGGPFIKPRTGKAARDLSEEEQLMQQTRESTVYSKCLHIVQCALQNVHCDLESETSLTTFLNTLIIPAVQQAHDTDVRELGLRCLGLAALLSNDLASSNLDLFFHCFVKGHDALKEIVIQVLADVVITHPQLFVPTIADPNATTEDAEPIANPRLKPLTKILLKGFSSDNKHMSLIACNAASKLLLLGVLPAPQTAEIVKKFAITYFDPETAQNPALRQALSYFLPVFCHSKLKNTRLMAQIAVPIVSKLLLMREEIVEEEDIDEMVGWPVITAHLADWTDGRKVVGATELGLDGKESTTAEAEEAHIQLANEVLERALTSTCSKDERKPLLALLGKLHIAPSSTARKGDAETSDGDSLHTLHGLVTEAVEGKIGTDATQRNALAKLEVSLTKRLGEVEHVTQVQDNDSPEPPVVPEGVETDADNGVTEVPAKGNVDETQINTDEEEEDDTMFAGMQGESTRMPLEDDDEEEIEEDEETTMAEVPFRPRPAITEDDIMESLLQSEM